MTYCGQCGQDVSGLRFCTRCGAPVDDAPRTERLQHVGDDQGVAATEEWREPDDTPPIWQPIDHEPEPRYEPPVRPVPAPTPPPTQPAPPPSSGARDARRRWVPWVIAGWVVLAIVAGVVAWRLGVADAEDERPAAQPVVVDPPPSEAPADTATLEPSDDAASATPSPTQTDPAEPTGEPTELARDATATVPATAPPNEDVDGDLVRYEAANMLDGVASTAWRMPGDGAGQELTFTFDEPVTLTQVGLTNGYAKVDGSGPARVDWYERNRRLVSAQWVFDDGTIVPESFADSLEPQVLDVGPVTTTTVRLRIVETTDPAPGPDGRDYTPISEIVLTGTPAA